MGISHIIRGKEHYTNMIRQEFMYRYLGWKYPIAIHYGRLKIEGTTLSKSKILQGISDKLYEGFDDPRLATFLALKRRGIQAEAIRRMIYDVNVKPVDVQLSWPILYSYNKQIVDKLASRYFAIVDQIQLDIKNVNEDFNIEILRHPQVKSKGYRKFVLKCVNGTIKVFISKSDEEVLLAKETVRLMNFINISHIKQINGKLIAEFQSSSVEEAKKLQAPLIHWLPLTDFSDLVLIMPTNKKKIGIVEKTILDEPIDSIVQLERVGFGRIDTKKNNTVVIYYISR